MEDSSNLVERENAECLKVKLHLVMLPSEAKSKPLRFDIEVDIQKSKAGAVDDEEQQDAENEIME